MKMVCHHLLCIAKLLPEVPDQGVNHDDLFSQNAGQWLANREGLRAVREVDKNNEIIIIGFRVQTKNSGSPVL